MGNAASTKGGAAGAEGKENARSNTRSPRKNPVQPEKSVVSVDQSGPIEPIEEEPAFPGADQFVRTDKPHVEQVLGRSYKLVSDIPDNFLEQQLGPVAGINNVRRINNTHIYGCAQGTAEGISNMVNLLVNDGYSKILWANLREEATVFVGGHPYSSRKDVNVKQDYLVGIEASALENIEDRLRTDVFTKACDNKTRPGFVGVHHTRGANYEPRTVKIEHDNIITTKMLFRKLRKECGVNLIYRRIPITDENAPEERDFDDLVTLLRQAYHDTAVVFNCQSGRGRSTTAMVCALLMARIRDGMKPLQARRPNRVNPQLQRGDYWSIVSACDLLNDGHTRKAEVDDSIDRASHLVNLRTCILDCLEKVEHSSSTFHDEGEGRDSKFYHKRGLNYMERYFFLIVFNAYLSDQRGSNSPFSTSFSKWFVKRAELQRRLKKLSLDAKPPSSDPMGETFASDQGTGDEKKFPMVGNKVLRADVREHKMPEPPIIDGLHNFRKVHGLPIYGVAQGTKRATRDALIHLFEAGHSSVLWFNLREELLILINDDPYCVRDSVATLESSPEGLNRVERGRLEKLERKLASEVKEISTSKPTRSCFCTYHKKGDGTYQIVEVGVEDESLSTMADLFTDLKDQGVQVDYLRVPITTENAPEDRDFTDIIALIRQKFTKGTAIVFNCEDGGERTTTGMIIATLYLRKLWRMQAVGQPPVPGSKPNYQRGEYDVVNTLVRQLDGVEGVKSGLMVKQEVDEAINANSKLVHLRNIIYECKERSESFEADTYQAKIWHRQGMNFLERYWSLIAFNAYLEAEFKHRWERVSFVEWFHHNSSLRRMTKKITLA